MLTVSLPISLIPSGGIDWLENGSSDVRRMMISLSILLHLNT
jgi:hypothetical protein